MQLLEAFQFLQILVLGSIKLGALLFYRRIFCGYSRNVFRTIIQVFVTIVVLWTTAMFIMNGVQCGSHLSALWATDPNVYDQYCIYTFPWETGFAISNFTLDLFIILLPFPKVGRDNREVT